MTDSKRDIWKEDEGARVEKRPPGRRRVGIFLLVLILVLGVVAAAAYRDGTGFDALRRRLSYRGSQTAGSATIYHYDASAQNRYADLGGTLVVLSDTRLQVLSGSGEEIWSTDVNMKCPAIHQGGGRAVAYDVGGTELYVVDASGERMHLTEQDTGPLIAARLNEDGWLAVTAERQGYKGSVAVYGQALGQPVFVFNSSDRFVTDACVSRGGRYLAAVTLGQSAGTFISSIVLYSMTEEEPMASYDISDGLAAAIAEQEGKLIAVCDTCLTLAGSDGKITGSYAYGGSFLRGYDLGGDDFTALLLNRYQSGSVGRLVTVDGSGAEIASLKIGQEVLDLSAAGRYLAVLYTDRLEIYNPELQVYAVLNGTGFASDVLMRRDGTALLLAADSARLFLP